MVEVEGGYGALNVVYDEKVLGNDLEVSNLISGDYELLLTDETSCTVDSIITITQFSCPFYIPNAFSPNGGGINDLFEIYTHPEFEGIFQSLKIYDRWGNLIFDIQSTDNTQYVWNGNYKGKQLPSGSYAYILAFNYLEREKEIVTETINLLK